MEYMNEGQLSLRAEVCNNRDYAELHGRNRMPRFGSILSSNETEESKSWSASLLAIGGITEAYCFDHYRLSVKKADLYSWEELMPQVIRVVAEKLAIKGELCGVAESEKK